MWPLFLVRLLKAIETMVCPLFSLFSLLFSPVPYFPLHNEHVFYGRLTVRHLPDDWEEKYNIRPVMLESFVEKKRFTGTCYKAANWQLCGQTKGRGKLGPSGKMSVPIKDVWVYPLDKKFRSILKNWLIKRQPEYLPFSQTKSYNLSQLACPNPVTPYPFPPFLLFRHLLAHLPWEYSVQGLYLRV